MATYGGRRLREMNANTASIVGIELLAAAQGVELRKPHKPSAALQTVLSQLRAVVPFYDQDRYFAPDIEQASQLVASGRLNDLMPTKLLPSL